MVDIPKIDIFIDEDNLEDIDCIYSNCKGIEERIKNILIKGSIRKIDIQIIKRQLEESLKLINGIT